MRNYLSIVFLAGFLVLNSAKAQELTNVITNTYSRGDINKALVRDHSWINYPAYTDRDAWTKLPEQTRTNAIKQGEKYLGFEWPSIKATDYLEFTRSGNRAIVDDKNREFSEAFRALLMAELMEGKGRFRDDLINGVFSLCERTYWGSSAHFYLYGHEGSMDKPTTVVPDLDDPVIDLVVGDLAADLAWSFYFLHDEFDKVSPVISKRIKDELNRKVLEPYYTRNDFWWIYGWRGEGNVNNWNPWVNYNVLTCILLMEQDPVKKADALYKSLGSVDQFINNYPQDGSCSEGPGYWSSAVGRFYSYLDLVHRVTKGQIDIFQNQKVKEMARYIYRVYISKGMYYTNYADAAHKIERGPAPLHRIGTRIDDPELTGFAAFLHKHSGDQDGGLGGRIGESLEILFEPINWAATTPKEPLISEFYFPDWDAVIARDQAGTTDGFYFSAKGGSNNEQHNHNDVGSFMLHFNGDPIFIDLGVGTYTRETFGRGRYDIWTMQSNYHNLPVINGLGQKNGGAFKATNSSYTPSKNAISYSTDLAKAYTEQAHVKSWQRTYTLQRGKKFIIRDQYQLAENSGKTSLHFMTKLPAEIIQPGMIRLRGDDFDMQMKYNQDLLTASIENIKIDDPKLLSNLGNEVNRLVFEVKNKGLNGVLTFEVTPVK
ncbi:heparinase II/III domain-containing protein [Arundinibacter roseus]|uniref:Heparinase n=1 Tax=Arundinibacter roseus TaxID=2070510 RepID=A0A4R4K952_9BACT|nr:heparinase II/III family protein [Arundinibacter roseus]TDB62699.1 heparinase [Arundinibacter roseus]